MRIFKTLQAQLRKLLTGDDAQDLIEYGLAVSLIALALIGGMNNLATALVSAFTNISTTLTPTQHRRDYDHLDPGPFYSLPGFTQTPPGRLLAAQEKAADRSSGMLNRHAVASGQSSQFSDLCG